ncbi:hypothetical protein [Mycolicibacterium sp.]|uniref:hypothetical protein n=1 Tax=Mycolicibacterium sp. TaxID=2320850 RepID=UPI0037C68B80
MRLDWYDREILTFVLDRTPRSEPPNEESFSRFGIAPHRVMRRFDAVVDVFTTHEFALEESDLNLVQRAAEFHQRV